MKLFKNFIDNHKKNYLYFDEVTRVRLLNAGFGIFIINIIIPVVSQYYYLLKVNVGDYIIPAATIIGAIGFAKSVAGKFNEKILKSFSFSNLFIITICFDIMFNISALLYFVSLKWFIWTDAIIAIFSIVFGIAFMNALNNYVTYFQPEKYTKLQNYRTSLWADATIGGTIVSIILTAISIKLAVIVAIIFGLVTTLYMLTQINKFVDMNFKFMLRYHKSLRDEDKK